MSRLAVAIISANNSGHSLYRMLKEQEDIKITALVEQGNTPLFQTARTDGIFVATELQALRSLSALDIIVDTTEGPRVGEQLKQSFSDKVLIFGAAFKLLKVILKDYKRLVQARLIQSELAAILDSVQEAIEVADQNGVIKYVNPAFTRITGIPESERVGQNIFDASPEGALATALRTGRSVTGFRTTVGGSNAEVISNAAPIMIDGQMAGVVVVFQHFTDIMKLMDELRQSSTIIENLSDKFGQVTTSKYSFADILGTSIELRRCIQLAERAARSNSTVLLMGESGTGKELFAHAIHGASPRREKPFIKVNCAAIPDTLLESEFFGYAKGAFTGAVKSKIGKFELANGGTIFLDEIGDMNLNLQGKLLRVLQEMEFERVGGNQIIQVDVRVIAATNRNLRDLIRQGKFREDLYYRLNVVEITVPPLRTRKDDLPVLVNNLIVKLNRKLGKKVKGLSRDAEEVLFSYDWPGNVRELENLIERVMVTVDADVLTKKHLIQHVSQFKSPPERDIELIPIDQMEQLLIKKAMAKFGSTVEGKRRAAQALNISLATLYNKLKKGRSEGLDN